MTAVLPSLSEYRRGPRRCGSPDRRLPRAGSCASARGVPWSQRRSSTRRPSWTGPAARRPPIVGGASGHRQPPGEAQELVLVLLDRLSRAAFEPFPQPVLGCLAYGVGGVPSFRGDPHVHVRVQGLQLVLDWVLALPATFIRMRRWPSGVYPRDTAPRQMPGQPLCRSGSRQVPPQCSKWIESSPHPRRHGMSYPRWGQVVGPFSADAETLPGAARHRAPGKCAS